MRNIRDWGVKLLLLRNTKNLGQSIFTFSLSDQCFIEILPLKKSLRPHRA